MESMGSYVIKVRKLFGHWADYVSRLAIREQHFRSKCDDYGMTVDEYRELKQELERDLEHELLASSKKADD